MIQNFVDSINIPQKCFLNKTLFKRLFIESGMLDITDKKALKDDIGKLRWLYTLKPSTINIEPFKDSEREYDEVEILQIDLTSLTRVKRIASFVNRAIPYPLILIFTHGDMIALNVADKRINQADKTKWVVEDGWITHWFNPNTPAQSEQNFMADIAIKNLSFLNFYTFYSDVKDCVIALNVSAQTGTYNVVKGSASKSRIKKLKTLGIFEKDKADLQNCLKKEKQMGRQVEITTSIKAMADQINDIKQQL